MPAPKARTAPTVRNTLSISEAAQAAKVHPRTVHRWIAAGELRAYRLGDRFVRISVEDLDAMLRPIPAVGQ